MIERAFEAGADLISIDSPLSLPRGRTSVFDSDRTRQRYGITRECERLLRRRGIYVYPCLIPSMQALTKRGVDLAQKFRKVGIPVIESYPGAAQDIMGIPRKRAGIEYLSQGLAEFGIVGDFLAKKSVTTSWMPLPLPSWDYSFGPECSRLWAIQTKNI